MASIAISMQDEELQKIRQLASELSISPEMIATYMNNQAQ